MNNAVYQIPISNLLWVLGPVLMVAAIYFRWSLNPLSIFYATFRMFIQLILVGFVLTYVFLYSRVYLVVGILCVMLLCASWISLRAVKQKRPKLFPLALFAIFLGGVSTLVIVIYGVIELTPWYEPRYFIPIAGMIFSNSMNSVSLAAERFQSDIEQGQDYIHSRNAAYKTSLLPMTNSFMAVGLVSLPGMMTGQILAGVDPLIAVRYQIMVMCMLLGSSGVSSALYLTFLKQASYKKS